MITNELLTVAKTANLLGISEQRVRVALQNDRLPIGFAVKNKNRWTYTIFKAKVLAYLEK